MKLSRGLLSISRTIIARNKRSLSYSTRNLNFPTATARPHRPLNQFPLLQSSRLIRSAHLSYSASASSPSSHPPSSPPTMDTTETKPETNQDAQKETQTPSPLPALPAVDGSSATLEVGGAALRLDHLGPLVVNENGTLSRIANWEKMADIERENTLRILGKRNQMRLAKLRAAKPETDSSESGSQNGAEK